MNTLTLHPDRAHRRPSPRADLKPPAQPTDEFAEDFDEVSNQQPIPTSQLYLEPEGEGILFAAFCLLSSLLIYCGVILIHFLG